MYIARGQALEACVGELRSSNPSVDVSQLTTEKAPPPQRGTGEGGRVPRTRASPPGQALFKSFDSVVRAQLDPIWHKTSRRTRALVSDLQTIRRLPPLLVAPSRSLPGSVSQPSRRRLLSLLAWYDAVTRLLAPRVRPSACPSRVQDTSRQVTFFEYLETVLDAATALHPSERPHWVIHSSEAGGGAAREPA